MGLLDRLSSPPAAPTAPPPPAASPTLPMPADPAACLVGAAYSLADGRVGVARGVAGGWCLFDVGGEVVRLSRPPAAMPPDAVPPPKPRLLHVPETQAPAAPPAAPSATAPVTPPTVASSEQVVASTVAAAGVPSSPPVETSTEPAKRRGRPPGSKNKPTGEVTPEGIWAHGTVAATPSPVPAPTGGIRLYVGCAPVGRATSTLHAYVLELDASVRTACSVQAPDLRLAAGQLEFGRWKAALGQAVALRPPSPGDYVVTSGDERIDVVVSALYPLAELVVRA